LVKRDGKRADAPTRRVEYCVGNGGGDADDRDLAHALDSQWVHRVSLADEDDLDVGHVRVHGHQVVPEGGVGDSPGPGVGNGLLQQGHAKAANSPPDDLAGRGLLVEDTSTVDCRHYTRDPDETEVWIYMCKDWRNSKGWRRIMGRD
jgi:hypothetical protein